MGTLLRFTISRAFAGMLSPNAVVGVGFKRRTLSCAGG
jgi:hypothetical protein